MTSKTDRNSHPKYRPDIDGLRALAVLPVILFHAGFGTFSGGFVGVDVFFVISGYLITTIILLELEQGKFSIVNFYERRARRILPALFFVMLTCLPFAWLWLLPHGMKSFSQSLFAVSIFASNIYFWRTSGYFDTATELKPLLHTWSLSVEEQYYVFFPLFLLFAWRFGKKAIGASLVVIACASLLLAKQLSSTMPSAAFYLLPTRAWELMVGALVAFYYTEHNINKHRHIHAQTGSLLGFALIVFSVFAYNPQIPVPGFYTLVPTLGAALIIAFNTPKTLVGKVLSNRLFVGVGLISYSAYLWHQPLIAFAKIYTLSQLGLGEKVLLLMATLLIAILSWRFIERPFRSRGKFSRRFVFSFAASCTAFFLLVGSILFIFPVSHYMHSDAVKKEEINAAIDDWGYPGSLRKGGVEDYYVYNRDRPVDVLFFGDSHAEQYAPLAEYFAQDHQVNVGFLTGGGCPPVPNLYGGGHQYCLSLFDRLDKVLSANEVSKIVIAACFNCYFVEPFRVGAKAVRQHYYYLSNGQKLFFADGKGRIEALNEFIRVIAALAVKREVYVLLDNPLSYKFDPGVFLLSFNGYNKDFFGRLYPEFTTGEFTPDVDVVRLNDELRGRLEIIENVRVFDVLSIVCPNNSCNSLDSHHRPLYKDGDHMRSSYVLSVFANPLSALLFGGRQ